VFAVATLTPGEKINATAKIRTITFIESGFLNVRVLVLIKHKWRRVS